MSFPKYADIELPLLKEIEAAGGRAEPKQLYSKVAAHFPQLTEADFREKFKHGENKWETMVAWARENLCKKDELSRTPRGIWPITDKGRERLKRQSPGYVPPTRLVPTTGTTGTPAPTGPTVSPQPSRHEQLKKAMVEIGQKLGYYTETEWGFKNYDRRHDVVWIGELVTPEHVIEICDGGSLDTDTVKLNQAKTKLHAKCILVVTDERNFIEAKSRFAQERGVVVVKAETAELFQKIVQDNPELLRLIFGK